MQSPTTFVRRTLYCLVSILFVTLLVLPTADRLIGFAPRNLVAESDSRKLPALTAAPASWLKYFNVLRGGFLERHYNLRNLLISWNSYLDIFVLASTNSSASVVAGEDHWLFLAQDGESKNIIEDARIQDPIPEESLVVLAREFERRREWLAERGIRYLVVVAPNKNTVYPEKLPESLRPVGRENHLSQFVRYVREHTNVDIVDVTQALLEAKKTAQVYYKTDSHWNANGGFAAYQDIMKNIRRDVPEIPILDRDRFRVERFDWLSGDLAYMMGLSEYLKEDRMMYFNKDWFTARGSSYDGPDDPHYFERPQYSMTGNVSLPNAVVFHDSFWWEILPFFAESFDRVLSVWLKPQTGSSFRFFDTRVVEEEKPAIVIEEFTERYVLPPVHSRFRIQNDVAAAAK